MKKFFRWGGLFCGVVMTLCMGNVSRASALTIPEGIYAEQDSLAGMKGAKNAGMKCVGIATSVPVSKMADADIRLTNYGELSIRAVEALFD